MLSLSFTDHVLTGDEMTALLERKYQHWDQLKSTGSLRLLASHTHFGVIFEDDEPMVYLFEMPGEPGTMHVLMVKERNRADKRHEELKEIGFLLANRWRGFRRVESKVAVDFVQTHRVLRKLGFTQETSNRGLKAYYTHDGKPVDVHVFAMLPEETLANHENAKMTEEVGYGV